MIRERFIDPLVTLWKCSMTLSIRCRFRLEEGCRCRGNLLFLSFSLNILDISSLRIGKRDILWKFEYLDDKVSR